MTPGLAAAAAERLFTTVIRHSPPVREKSWAAGATRFSVPSRHGDLAAWVWGGGSKTVLLVHGWAGRGLQMGAFVRPLVDAGRRVVAYDAPSHGESPGRRANLFKLTDGLVAVVKAVGPVDGVVAHSLGTTAVLLAASRGAVEPARFVAVAPVADTTTMTRWYASMTGFSLPVVDEMRLRLERRYGFRWDDVEPVHLAAGLNAETLVIHDRDDRELPASDVVGLASAMPSARAHATRGLGHRRILRDSGVVAMAAEFITGERSRPPHRLERAERARPAA